MYWLIPFLLYFHSASAAPRHMDFVQPDFESAAKAESFLRFDLESSLVGFLTARFPGYAKKFTLNWDNTETTVRNLQITIPVASMDTNRESRTKEMQRDCLEGHLYPDIQVNIKELKLEPGTVKVPAEAWIRGKQVTIPTTVTLSVPEPGQWTVSGVAPVQLKDINVNNPTIMKGVASFNDHIKIHYNFRIPVP